MIVNIKLLNKEIKETNNRHVDLKHLGLFFCKVAYSSYDTPLFME